LCFAAARFCFVGTTACINTLVQCSHA
jgi:hypothetical protein